MATKTSEEGTIPCAVTDPDIRVSLYEKHGGGVPLEGSYSPTEGFTALLEDRLYVCRGERDGEVRESQGFNVCNRNGGVSPHLDAVVGAEWVVLLLGAAEWGGEEEQLHSVDRAVDLERLAPPQHQRGFVDLRSDQGRNVSARLHENVELRVEIKAYPPPKVLWSKDGTTINGEKSIVTKPEHETR
ncbi:hypothetical protein CRUP_009843 [Coryphaenoides rupestris]|nr:hypothetical protein CRUP_009843 [Coryphaenoides rupestris]